MSRNYQSIIKKEKMSQKINKIPFILNVCVDNLIIVKMFASYDAIVFTLMYFVVFHKETILKQKNTIKGKPEKCQIWSSILFTAEMLC